MAYDPIEASGSSTEDSSESTPAKTDFTQYRPIPYGGLRLTAFLMPTIIATAFWTLPLLVKIFTKPLYGWADVFTVLFLSLIFVALLLCWISLASSVFLGCSNPRIFISDYIRKNVVGYSRYIRETNYEPWHHGTAWYHQDNYNHPRGIFPGYVRIYLPIGGWWPFRQPACVWASGERQLHIKVRLFNFADAVSSDPPVSLTDSYGARELFPTLSSAVAYLSQQSLINAHERIATIGNFALEAKLLRENAAASKKNVKILADAVVAARDGIANTTRFSKSKDAKKIREALNQSLRDTSDPRADITDWLKPGPYGKVTTDEAMQILRAPKIS